MSIAYCLTFGKDDASEMKVQSVCRIVPFYSPELFVATSSCTPHIVANYNVLDYIITDIEDIKLKEPLTIKIFHYPDEYCAYFDEIGAKGEGKNKQDAIDDLKEDIKYIYKEIISQPESKLGFFPRQWKNNFLKYI